MSGDDVGGWIVGLVVVGGIIWAFSHYEISKKDEPKLVALPASPIVPIVPKKPTGLSRILELDNKTVWLLDNDSVKGDNAHRLGWVKEDHSKNKDKSARFTSTLYSIDCTTTGYRELTAIDYDKDGHGTRQGSNSTSSKELSYVPPDSNMGRVIEAMCAPSFDLPPTAALPAPSPIALPTSSARP